MARIRTFIAVNISDSIRERAATLQKKIASLAPGIKWVEPESMHLTLHFLGEVEELDLVSICRVVTDCARNLPAFSVRIGTVGVFPTPRRPKILWLGVQEGAESLTLLHQVLEKPLLATGCYRKEDRPYYPHLTLGRISQDDRELAWSTLITEHREWYGGHCDIHEILVMRSENHRDRPIYTVVGRGRLRGLSVPLETQEHEEG